MNVKKYIHLLFFFVFLFSFFNMLFAQKNKYKPSVNWINLEQLQDSMRIKPKKIFIDLYTDWCGPCKLMDKKVFTNKYVIKLLNEHYYAVKLNGESRDTLTFNGKKYVFVKKTETRGTHELAYFIGTEAGKLSYPTVVILDETYAVIYRYPAYISAQNLEYALELYK